MTSLRDDYVAMLERENDELRARLHDLEAQLGLAMEWPPQLQLTAHEGKLFGMLMKRDLVSKEFAITNLYLHKQDEAEIKIVDVYICKARKKLKPWGIEIETVWGQGYRLPPASKQAALRLLDEARGLEVAAVARLEASA